MTQATVEKAKSKKTIFESRLFPPVLFLCMATGVALSASALSDLKLVKTDNVQRIVAVGEVNGIPFKVASTVGPVCVALAVGMTWITILRRYK